MRFYRSGFSGVFVFLLLTAATVFRASACPIPVFRYALEFWEPDPYRATVYYRDSLTPGEEEAVEYIEALSTGRDMIANVDLTLVDVAEDDGSLRYREYDEQTMPHLPWMVVRYPYIENIDTPAWSGEFTPGNAEFLMESPARRRLAESLAEGRKVWVIVESGNRSRDRAVRELLDKELERLEQTLALPDPEQWFVSDNGMPEPEIKFELMSISRDSPAEKFLLGMLLNSEKDLHEFESQPMVFPVYGRGIALWAIVGDGINTWNITDAAEFLIGPCSCQVKMLNPGVDLLIAKDWSGYVDRISDETLAARAPATGFEEFERRGEEAREKLEGEEEARTLETDPGKTAYVDIFREEDEKETAEGQEGAGEEEASGMMLPALLAGIIIAAVAAGVILFKTAGRKDR